MMPQEQPQAGGFRVDAALGPLQEPVEHAIEQLRERQAVRRLWSRDPHLWKNEPAHVVEIRQRLGWLDLPDTMLPAARDIQEFADTIGQSGMADVVLCGMGGSSLCPEVFSQTFGSPAGYPRLTVLDSTHPDAIRMVDQQTDPARTMYIISSKSGGTIEVMSLFAHFWAAAGQAVGNRAGDHFIAITDQGTSLEQLARDRHFRRAFMNPPDIGGRYSALSFFGLVPGALIGLDVSVLLARARETAMACRLEDERNPGLWLGAVLGAAARHGRDKLTFFASPAIASLGLWLEQLLAESTGKEGRGILPVAGEAPGPPDVYGDDRLFVYLRLGRDCSGGDSNAELDRRVAALRDAGQPVVTIHLRDRLDLGAEFFRWEVATAIAGGVLEINPFDQPNVQESKDNTARILREFAASGELVEPPVDLEDGDLRLSGAEGTSIGEALTRFVRKVRPGDYLALLVFLAETPALASALDAFRLRLRDHTGAATTLGYGPRYLHSTGQYHKGGPPLGVFIQVVGGTDLELPVPEQPYTFGTLVAAQALGDLEALRHRDRPALRIALGANVGAGIERLVKALD